MGASRPLDHTALTISYRPPPQSGNNGWFGPLNPMQPVAPMSVKGRILDYPSGYNLNIRPRSYEAITFDMLRAFADSYDLLRILIETRKDQMARLSWNIVPRDKKLRRKGAKLDTATETRVNELIEFFLRPDRENFWGDWLRMLLEDLFVIDAPTVYRRKTFGDDLYALQPIDGGTIKRVIDDFGNTPTAPLPAYQQVLKGYPAVDYTTEELIYRPRNKRTHKVYGYSPVEQIVMTINIGMRRQAWQLQSFTEGNIPEALIGTPDSWTPEQVAQFQTWFDSLLTGNTAERRRARFVPGGVAKGYVPTKTDEIFGKGEEWLVRVICAAFSVSPQPFVQQMNRATAETAQEAATMEGLAPIQGWVKGLMDTILIDDFASPDLEFVWEEEDELDPDKKSQIVDREQAAGRLTYNEARREQGLDPIDHPDADRPMFKSASGWTPIFLTPEEQAAKDAAAEAMKQALGAGGEPGEEEEDGDGPPKPPGGAPTPPAPPPADGEVAEKSDAPFLHKQGCGCGLAKAGRASRTSDLDPLRPAAAKIEKRLGRGMRASLILLGQSVAKQVVEALEKLGKADEPEVDIDAILAGLDLSSLSLDFDDLEDALDRMGKDAARVSLSMMGMTAKDDLVERVNERAHEWASERAAELVSFDDDAEPLLARATRDMLRTTIADGIANNLSMPDIGDAIRDNYAFSEDRAMLIAATEITSANSMGALASYQEAEAEGIKVKKSWLILEDACDICQENADAGAIDLDDTFPSGDDAPGAHPNCRCVLVPEVEEGGDTDGEPLELSDKIDGLAKKDNRDEMSLVFPVDTRLRGHIWAMGGNSEEAVAERESSLLQFVPFEDCIATQDYCDRDKVDLYMKDPTAKGFAPMAYQLMIGDCNIFAIQDGHHRAVASKLLGNAGMSMNVKQITVLDKADQPRNLRGKFTSDPGQSFMSSLLTGIPGVRARIGHIFTELAGDVDGVSPEDDTQVSEAD